MAIKNPKWVSISEASNILGISVSTIRRKIKSKDLKYKKVGGVYQIEVSGEVEEQPNKQEQPKESVSEYTRRLEIENAKLSTENKEKTEYINFLKDVYFSIKTGKLLADPNANKSVEGEVVNATGQVQQSGNVDTQPTKDKKQVWKYPLYVLILMATLGLIGLMLYQSGIVTL